MDIQLKDVSKKFGSQQVINQFNAVFAEGRINCLMGASGIGKTTIINLVMGLIKQDSGEILGVKDRQIAVVFQEDRLIEHWDAVKNVKLTCDKTVTVTSIEQELQRVGLEDYKEKPVQGLSGGMRRRVAIVRAMLANSDLIIMDEPFKGLDDALKKQVILYVKQRSFEKTVIIVTHDIEEVLLLEAKLITIE